MKVLSHFFIRRHWEWCFLYDKIYLVQIAVRVYVPKTFVSKKEGGRENGRNNTVIDSNYSHHWFVLHSLYQKRLNMHNNEKHSFAESVFLEN